MNDSYLNIMVFDVASDKGRTNLGVVDRKEILKNSLDKPIPVNFFYQSNTDSLVKY